MRRLLGASVRRIGDGRLCLLTDAIHRVGIQALELALPKDSDPRAMVETINSLDLSRFDYVSFHMPGTLGVADAQILSDLISWLQAKDWPIVAHPDAAHLDLMAEAFGDRLCIENMDRRKRSGRTAAELETLFAKYPRAMLCFDIGHAQQVDPTMTEAAFILRRLGGRLRQMHLSAVDSQGNHERLTYTALQSFRKVASLISRDLPVILETPGSPESLATQISLAERALMLSGGGEGSSHSRDASAVTDGISARIVAQIN